jgi:hypothetical protein
MTEARFGRLKKAATLVPLAVLSAAWSASIVGVGLAGSTATSADGEGEGGTLPDGSTVPTQAIEAPASLTGSRDLAPGIKGDPQEAVLNAATNGIPTAALAAYQRAETVINAADTTCHLPWQLVAAIGRVESDHGSVHGSHLTGNGLAKPPIFGLALDGTHDTSTIADTDGGALDGDAKFDRAVGPMQFIPSTWSVVGVDADGDGQRNPQDIDDAALATAVYLCSGKDDLGTDGGRRSSVFRYNHSQQYVDLVLRLMEAYSQGDYTAVPAGTSAGTLFTPDYAAAVTRAHHQHVRQQHAAKVRQARSSGASTGSTGPTGSTGGSGTGTTGGVVPSSPSTPSSGGSGGVLGGVLGGGSGSGGGSGGGGTGTVTQPVVDLITSAEAETLCTNKLDSLSALLQAALPGDAEAVCEQKLTGQPQADASSLLDNVLKLLLG